MFKDNFRYSPQQENFNTIMEEDIWFFFFLASLLVLNLDDDFLSVILILNLEVS